MMADQNRPGEIDDELLARFVAGEATAAERAEIERWAAEAPENNIELSVFRRLWDQSGSLPSPERLNTMWQSLQREMNEPERPEFSAVPPVQDVSAEDRPTLESPPSTSGRRRLSRIRSILMPVVVSVLLVGGVALFWTARGDWGEKELVLELARDVQTGRGESTRLHLVDGTRVEIGPESSLSIRYYAGGAREMKLTGEAIFDMVHDEARPFRVHSGNAITEGRGTRFSVRAYPADPHVRVAVADGVVSLRSAAAPEDSTAILRVGEVARLTDGGRIELDTVADAAGFFAWPQNRFVFRHVPLKRVAADLERWYDVAIRVADEETAAEYVTLDIRARQLDDVLHAIAAPLELQYERRGDTIIFRP